MSLQRYINQLLQDIGAATQNVPEPWYPLEEEADEEFGVLPWMEDPENAPTKSLEEWTSLKKEQFPPESRLTDTQVSDLLCAMKAMLDAYNCSAVFQIEVPDRIQYRVIRERFRQEVPMLKANYFFFELCDKKDKKDRSGCLLGEKYCHCADPYEEYMLKRRYGDDWHKYIAYEEEVDFEGFQDDEDLGFEDFEDDSGDDFPF